MYRLINNATIPKALKVLLYILLTLTCIYWISIMTYKILELLRKSLHWCSEKRNWWTFVVCIAILAIGSLLIAQYLLDLDPIGKVVNWVVTNINEFRNKLGNIIIGVTDAAKSGGVS